MTATFSVVVPTHNRAERVVALVGALRELEGAPEEIVVVDDGSRDDTAARLAALAGDDLRVVATTGVGPASARNRGAEAATGEWLTFIDDDDLPEADWMTEWRSMAEANPAARYLSVPHVARFVDREERIDVRHHGPALSSVTAEYMPGCFAVRRTIFLEEGGYLEGLRYLECTELATRMFAHLASEPTAFASGSHPTVTRVVDPPDRRSTVRPRSMVPSARIAHEAMRPYLEREPVLYANSLATLGVAEARMGDLPAARRTLRRAARADPWPPRHVLRAVAIHVPVLGARVWRGRPEPTS